MAMREARFSRPSHVQLVKGSIASAISHVSQTFRKHGRPDPTLDDDGKTGFLLQRELRAFKNGDPAEKHPDVSDISTCQATDLGTRQRHCSAHGVGHFLCIQVLQVSQSPTG